MEIYTLITILTIYIIGVIVAYGLALGDSDDDTYEMDRRFALLICFGSWIAVALLAGVSFIENGRLCFQWRRKG